MHDDYASPIWVDRHGAVSAFLGGLIDEAKIAFERLAARTYDAPWRQRGASGCAGASSPKRAA